MGMSMEEAGAKMIEMATAAGMSSGQIDALRAALAAAQAAQRHWMMNW